jgi:hypothetical protein
MHQPGAHGGIKIRLTTQQFQGAFEKRANSPLSRVKQPSDDQWGRLRDLMFGGPRTFKDLAAVKIPHHTI